jgi:hypothetical protein
MPDGKPAGIRCVQLTPDNKCRLFGKPERPQVCINFNPSQKTCGETNEDAYRILAELEEATKA